MKWNEVQEIAIELADAHPDVDPTTVNFVDLMNWVLALPEFDDDPKRCGERILEGIQQAVGLLALYWLSLNETVDSVAGGPY